MSGLKGWCNSGEVALVANTAKSVLQVKAAANQRCKLTSLRLFGKQPAGGTDAVVKIRMTQSSANFGTFSAATPGKNNTSNPETIQTTFGSNASVEPTTPTDSGLWWEVQPQAGIEEFLPIPEQIEIPGGRSVQFECTSTGTPTIMLAVGFDE